MERAIELRGQLARAIAPFLGDRRLKPGERTVLRAILIEQLDDILANVDVPDPDLQALFERLHGVAYGEAVQEDIDEVRSGMAAMFDELGIDVDLPDLRAGMSEEEAAAGTVRKLPLSPGSSRRDPGVPTRTEGGGRVREVRTQPTIRRAWSRPGRRSSPRGPADSYPGQRLQPAAGL